MKLSLAQVRRCLVQAREIPALTTDGFQVISAPANLASMMRFNFERRYHPRCPREPPVDIVQTTSEHSPACFIEQDDLNNIAHHQLQGVVEKWCDMPLIPVGAYGIRAYQRGALLEFHLDKPRTHPIGVVMNVHQQLDAPWPLMLIEPWSGKRHEINLEPGQLLLYESARMIHGRPLPLQGGHVASLLFHYKPVWWDRHTHLFDAIEDAIDRDAKLGTIRTLSAPPKDVLQVSDVTLTVDERNALITLAEPRLRPLVPEPGAPDLADQRVGFEAVLGREHPLICRLQARIAAVVGVREAQIEPVRIQRFGVMGRDNCRMDAFDPGCRAGALEIDVAGQRTHTLFGFLTAEFTGGAVQFIHLDRTINPVPGQLMCLRTADNDGPIRAAARESMPVWSGEKWFFVTHVRIRDVRRTSPNAELLTLRPGKQQDIERLVDLAERFHGEMSQHGRIPFDRPTTHRFGMWHLTHERGFCMVAEDNGEIIGFMMGAVSMWAIHKEQVGTDSVIYILPQYRGKLGRRLLESFLDWAKERSGWQMLTETAGAASKAYRRMVMNMGFEQMGTVYIRMNNP
jgi:GNAT superfamily N-acetyltransferase